MRIYFGLLIGLLINTTVFAHSQTPPSLKGIKIPPTPGLLDGADPIVINKTAAIQLGKALFWDMNVGVDGIACATCHFHAGADGRFKNQLSPGKLHRGASTRLTFSPTASGGSGGPNYQMKAGDFPFYQLNNPADRNSTVLFDTDDVLSSAGAFHGKFQKDGSCISQPDSLFHLGGLNTRRVTNRQAPSIINAAFNFRNFWDGRANNIFNGVSEHGDRDVNAGVWVLQSNGKVTKQKLRLENSALASQAMSPPLNSSEMSCSPRTFPDIGRNLLPRRALENQEIHPEDSVFASVRHPSGKGLRKTYRELIKKSFAPKFWNGTGNFPGAEDSIAGPYTHLETNFSLFFGIALQLYQQTLIADQTPFDTPRISGEPEMPKGLNEQQREGLHIFLDGHCATCHKGPSLSSAAHPDIYTNSDSLATLRLVNRKTINGSFTGHGVAQGIIDEGYFNTSVTPTEYDLGLGENDPYGNPLSFTQQYLNSLLTGVGMIDPITVYSCELDNPFVMDFTAKELIDDQEIKDKCGVRAVYAKIPQPTVISAELRKGLKGRILPAVKGAFKVPSLRNIELTGPYMHNGSMLTLEQVVEFYFRGGNFNNPHHFATLVFQQGFSDTDKANLVAFLKSLTDERVRWEKAPFDHPQLLVPQGHKITPDPKRPTRAEDVLIDIPAVGKNGRGADLGPIKAFHEYLEE